MKERPVLFSGEMVRAILEGRKTQTRRVIKPQPLWVGDPNVAFKTHSANPKGIINCPYGQPGDRLWVRETFAGTKNTGFAYRATDTAYGHKWRPSIFMPHWASRINLEVVSVRVERVQDISIEDAYDEGMEWGDQGCGVLEFKNLWDSINLKRGYGWDANPWVWVIEFKRLP